MIITVAPYRYLFYHCNKTFSPNKYFFRTYDNSLFIAPLTMFTLCMLSNFSSFSYRLSTFFKINFFKKFSKEHYQKVKKFRSRSKQTFCLSCFWVQILSADDKSPQAGKELKGITGPSKIKNKFSYFSTKTYVVGTQKNRLNETVLLSTQNICSNGRVRKYSCFYAQFFFICSYSNSFIYQLVSLFLLLSIVSSSLS